MLQPGEHNWPKDAVVYDVTGKTVMPGLIDLHSHLTFLNPEDSVVYSRGVTSGAESVMRGLKRMALFIESGITSVRDVGSHGDSPFVLKRLQSAGEIQGPRIFAAGELITSTGGHADIHAFTPGYPEVENGNPNAMVRIANGPDQWREAVRIQYQKGRRPDQTRERIHSGRGRRRGRRGALAWPAGDRRCRDQIYRHGGQGRSRFGRASAAAQ